MLPRKLPALIVLLVLLYRPLLIRAEDPAADFLDIEAAKKAIVDDAKEPYFAKLTDPEMSAKTAIDVPGDSHAQRLDAVKTQYQEAVRAFTPEEEETLRWYLDRLKEPLEKDYPLFAAIPWRFIKVRGDLEAGMPHTRGGCVVLSERVLSAMSGMKQNAPPAVAMARMGGTLVHEKLHVMQRAEPKRFENLYVKVWGFEKVKDISGSDLLKSRWIVNPDGPDVNWVMPIRAEDKSISYVWPLILFTDADHPTLNQMQMAAVMVEKREGAFSVQLDESKEPVTKELLSVDGYTEKFFPSTYIYHPNEAAADLFSRVVVMDHFGGKDALRERPDADRVEAALDVYRKWFRKHLAP